jgi:uncharacterized protein with NAD-binding domain and iron-sulfur cluster
VVDRTAADGTAIATGVICDDERFDADAVIFAVGVTGMKKIVASSPSLQRYPEFCQLGNLGAVDVLATRLWFDRNVTIPLPSNACFGFDNTTGWTFFDLNALHDEWQSHEGSVIEVDFYHADQLLPMTDGDILTKVQRDLAVCVPGFADANIIDHSIIRLPNAVTHFAPGSRQFMLRKTTPIANLFMSGDWIITDHGSWSQEKAYVTGLEAANRAIAHLHHGTPAGIIPVEPDEPHIQIGRQLNKAVRTWGESWLPQLWL